MIAKKKLNLRFLSREEQEVYIEACNTFSNQKSRECLFLGEEISNLFKVLLLNQIGIRTATLPEIEHIVESGLDLKSYCIDEPSVILRSSVDLYTPHDHLAKSLAEKLKLRDFKTPKIITGLRIVEDGDSQYGLNFDTKDAQIIEAPDLDNRNHERKFSIINPDYSIEFDDGARRVLCTRNHGLSKLFMDRKLLHSGDIYLADMDVMSRVVVVH